jgi:hypothetical protein
MRNRTFVFSVIMILVCFAVANAADLNGKWKGDLQTPNGPLEINFDFHADGEKLTGTVTNTCGTEQITNGTLKEDAVSFSVLAGGGQFKITYKGTIVGDDLEFQVIIGEMGEGDLVA